MKNLLNLKGAQKIDKLEQQSINGGGFGFQLYCGIQQYGQICNNMGYKCCGPGLCVPADDPRCFK